MNILMVTNTYLPHVGGVAQSVSRFTEEYRKRGHRVVVLAPAFSGEAPANDEDVVRVPALQNFNGSDFSVRLPVPATLLSGLKDFTPDVVHSHHPFLLGDTAYRLARQHRVPLIFTHHTMYERYTHYVPGDSPDLKRFAIELSTGYANLCNRVIAPSESIAEILHERGVRTSISSVPTGIDTEKFADGDGDNFRKLHKLKPDAFIVGHVGRLAPEKNLAFLAEAVAGFMRHEPDSAFVVIGDGPSKKDIQRIFKKAGMSNRLIMPGSLSGQALVDAYQSFSVFAFASHSETQGMVVAEAMSCSIPVIALDAAGVREVVRDGENGFLLPVQDKHSFLAALRRYKRMSEKDRAAFQQAARRTAEEVSIGNTAEKMLSIYGELKVQAPSPGEQDETAWSTLLRNIELETQIRGVALHAAGRSLRRSALPFKGFWKVVLNLRARFDRVWNRAEWTAKLLKLERSTGTEHSPGLVMVQIDGLAKPQLEHALQQGRMPFLDKLLRVNGYHLHSMYSGLPSTTPSVQGELFYGKRMAVPAFGFYDPKTRRPFRMLDGESAAIIEDELRADAHGLLEGGSAYFDIYGAGAKVANLTSGGVGSGKLARSIRFWRLLLVLLLHVQSILRCFALALLEFWLAVFDCVSGLFNRKDLVKELKFIPTRVIVTILMREIAVNGAIVDVTRGVPVVHLNLLGYDEQSHRRGASSAFSHWTLKGIDDAIMRLFKATRRTKRRDYDVWIYSDHGQEDVDSYLELYGKPVQDAVNEVFGQSVPKKMEIEKLRGATESERAEWLVERLLPRWLRMTHDPVDEVGNAIKVAALGPIGYIYPTVELTSTEQAQLAKRLVEDAHIPLVLYPSGAEAAGYCELGPVNLPADAAKILPPDHPFYDDVVKDLIDLTHHQYAGAFLISGYSKNGKPMSFPIEFGAHAGPGPNETHAFVALPPEERVPKNKEYLYVRELHDRAEERLHGKAATDKAPSVFRKSRPPKSIRVMTYNVHGCRGMDNRLSPRRIARVISEFEPDIIALQELDVGRSRSDFLDQAHAISRALEMDFHFDPAVQVEEERYGNAILSSLPLKLVKSIRFPMVDGGGTERRSALWVEVDVDGQPVQVINTHLGLHRVERLRHSEILSGPDWIPAARARGPVVLCGDLNTSPRSEVYKLFRSQLEDVQPKVEQRKKASTWPGKFPFRRLDYVFTSEDLKVQGAYVPVTSLTKIASDHLPVVADLTVVAKQRLEEAA